ncbi:TPA: hypothetical protein U9N74_001232 [Streptococcus agalactiae]|uniref:Cytoplasmic protein n=2 Tax=Streptococcus agalactiae TaxID=1311 RepID=A0AAW6XUU4_STRAG|nr:MULTISPECIES: hypothetical protein [Streptococcus]EPT68412.1 hypothetical protein SAG0066_02870 [Streptococcus agalactiae CCUG 38383]AIF89433.1 hypothetical protein EN73_09575 [Streptococcus agalactiae]ALP88409.1 hypothetical protein AOY37_09875 [Streptococcus agalactiae]AYZ23556.1 hypothetical protein EGX82_06905 [Streptococcus agalactiae]EAO72146.1 conserved hypothetical protein [Streptococcus agalactiae 515]
MYSNREFAYFVNRRNNLDKMIDLLVFMIPDREFYYPEIQTGELRDYQIDIYDLIKIGYVGVYEIQKDYEDKLRELADFKRKLLKFGLLMQPLDRQKEIVMNLASQYRLHKRLLKLRENFRGDERD